MLQNQPHEISIAPVTIIGNYYKFTKPTFIMAMKSLLLDDKLDII